MKIKLQHISAAAGLSLLLGLSAPALAQPETMAWGNLTGIRVDGNLLELNSSMCVAQPGWTGVFTTGREKQTNMYKRTGSTETVTVQMDAPKEFRNAAGVGWAINATEVIEDAGPNSARIGLEFTSPKAADVAGAGFCLDLPSRIFSAGTVQLVNPVAPALAQYSLAAMANDQNEYVRAKASGVVFNSQRRKIEITFGQPTDVVIRDDRRQGNFDLQVYMGVVSGKTTDGQVAKNTFAVKVTGEIDKSPLTMALDVTKPGQKFVGLGGNFRLQNARTDPQVIQYSLDNIRVAFGRVEMPWRTWQPNEDSNPLADARAGKLPPAVQQAMEMARRLQQKGMPVIVSAWQPPAWSIVGAPRMRRGPDDLWGNPLNPEKADKIYESIANYLVFLKEKYGVEAYAFSFNESDLGINVRQTASEHALLIKKLGAVMASKGLATKMLLGDTSDATPVDFIKVAQNDLEAVKYIAAVSFHSWRGCTDEILAYWGAAARALNVPLLVAEGSTDAAAYRYAQIFFEQSFALYEINLYTRILAIAQPASILQWQFTADYSVLAGGGIYGDNGPLRPTQRYWNLKQLSATPPNVFALPVKCDKPELACAAFGNIADGVFLIHAVNNGGSRPATVTGLPATVKQLRAWVTDSKRGYQELPRINVVDGKADFTLDATSYTTLMSAQ
jgi:hypothetical protein